MHKSLNLLTEPLSVKPLLVLLIALLLFPQLALASTNAVESSYSDSVQLDDFDPDVLLRESVTTILNRYSNFTLISNYKLKSVSKIGLPQQRAPPFYS